MKMINKEDLITEINKRIDDIQKDLEIAQHKELEDYFEGYYDALSMFRDFINTLDVKDIVNHEPSVKFWTYTDEYYNQLKDVNEYGNDKNI